MTKLPEIPRKRERLLLTKMAVKLTKLMHSDAPFPSADTLYVYNAVYLSHLSGTALSAYKLALFLEMPRSTVAGRLDFLEKNGFVVKHGSAYRVSDERLKSSAILDRATKIIRDTCDALALGEKASVFELQVSMERHPQ